MASAESGSSIESTDSVSDGIRKSFVIDMGKGHVTGLFISRPSEEGQILGSFVNEFGISAISFSYDVVKKRVKLMDVISFLDKWYIRKVLGNDLKLVVETLYGLPVKADKSHIVTNGVDSISVVNTKRNITYTFLPLDENEAEE